MLLDRLSPCDRASFLSLSYGQHIPLPPTSLVIHHLFKQQVLATPSQCAISHPYSSSHPLAQEITYTDLDTLSSNLAACLRDIYSICPGKRVVILGRRGVPFVLGILATLKAGGQYVPLDGATIGDDTLTFVLGDCQADLVLCTEEFLGRNPLLHHTTLPLTLDLVDSLPTVLHPLDDECTPATPAYCIYTSGTTGKPKGVSVLHQGVANFLHPGHPGALSITPGTKVAHILSIAFDMGAWEILGTLLNGGELCIRGERRYEWIETLKRSEVVISTPSILAQHDPLEICSTGRGNVRRVIVGGEPCPRSLADSFAPHCVFTNCCGPTEISICNTIQEPPHSTFNSSCYVGQDRNKINIGRPVPNTNVYVLSADDSSAPVPVGAAGEMWVGGIGVSAGYIGEAASNPRMSARWRPDPYFCLNPTVSSQDQLDCHQVPMMFNTGDLVRWDIPESGSLKDASLEHLGRSDDQIKVRGFRVELEGVANSVISAEPPQRPSGCVVLLLPTSATSPDDKELVAFLTPLKLNLEALSEHVATSQPYYAIPTRWIALPQFKLGKNGKVDRTWLASVASKSHESEQDEDMATFVLPSVPRTPLPTPTKGTPKMGPVEKVEGTSPTLLMMRRPSFHMSRTNSMDSSSSSGSSTPYSLASSSLESPSSSTWDFVNPLTLPVVRVDSVA